MYWMEWSLQIWINKYLTFIYWHKHFLSTRKSIMPIVLIKGFQKKIQMFMCWQYTVYELYIKSIQKKCSVWFFYYQIKSHAEKLSWYIWLFTWLVQLCVFGKYCRNTMICCTVSHFVLDGSVRVHMASYSLHFKLLGLSHSSYLALMPL